MKSIYFTVLSQTTSNIPEKVLGRIAGLTSPKKALDFEEFAESIHRSCANPLLKMSCLQGAADVCGGAKGLAQRMLALDTTSPLDDTLLKELATELENKILKK